MNFTDLLDRLGSRAGKQATNVAMNYIEGRISLDVAVEGLEVVIRTSNTRGITLGQAACREVLRSVGDPGIYTAAAGATSHFEDAARISTAARTALDVPETAVMTVERLARSEAIQAAQKAYGSTLEQSPNVKGWTRGMEPDACELCNWWWREGRVWPKDYTIQTHPGCCCRQIPAVVPRSQMRKPGNAAWRASEARRELLERNPA